MSEDKNKTTLEGYVQSGTSDRKALIYINPVPKRLKIASELKGEHASYFFVRHLWALDQNGQKTHEVTKISIGGIMGRTGYQDPLYHSHVTTIFNRNSKTSMLSPCRDTTTLYSSLYTFVVEMYDTSGTR